MSRISQIGLGTWPFGGNDWSHGWGPQSEVDSLKVIIEALAKGIEIIDTAPAYGLGQAETIIGKALKTWRGVNPFITTKCGQEFGSNGRFRVNLTPKFIKKGLHDSLRRLQVEQVDLLFLHYPSKNLPETVAALEELTRLKLQGKVAQIGISNFSDSDITSVAKDFDIYACQSKYSILDRSVEEHTLKICRKNRIKFFAYQPLESGLLTGSFFPVGKRSLAQDDWRNRSRMYDPLNLHSLTPLITELSSIASHHSVKVASIALSWVLQNKYCDVALVGARNCEQLSSVIDANYIKLTQNEHRKIDKLFEAYKKAKRN